MQSADIIVLQFPLYWYSTPALLKKWLDDVFSYGFAYGADGDKLKNKNLILSFTTGGPEQSYDTLGYNHFPIFELIKPLKQTAYFTQMILHPPIISHNMAYVEGVRNTPAGIEKKATEHSQRLISKLNEVMLLAS
ncbi:NAD(P)H-dependent oxidoreductase [Thalassomonas actiniarum]|uniref:NAD(P)H-dependent oxidoreductase n=1 Tax=Thalassomonas actiniarum TaxID=485447 RepID=A0AAE9YXH2_9GAMM|nr:NAD(P)H-dependent oxidoreductase [Thalassomonas actiniarum]WDE02718.1 NAD(P)H-dependent oxidoreductase [Thalassomonas actiniarum]